MIVTRTRAQVQINRAQCPFLKTSLRKVYLELKVVRTSKLVFIFLLWCLVELSVKTSPYVFFRLSKRVLMWFSETSP